MLLIFNGNYFTKGEEMKQERKRNRIRAPCYYRLFVSSSYKTEIRSKKKKNVGKAQK